MNILEIIAILGGAGIFGFLGTIVGQIAMRNKNKAETEKLIAETEHIRIEAQRQMQDQLDGLRSQNKHLFEERELERQAKEKLRDELNRLHNDIELIRKELFIERQRANMLLNELDAQRAGNMEKTVKIEGLQSLVSQQQKAIERYGVDIGVIKKQTGQLPPAPERMKDGS